MTAVSCTPSVRRLRWHVGCTLELLHGDLPGGMGGAPLPAPIGSRADGPFSTSVMNLQPASRYTVGAPSEAVLGPFTGVRP